MRKEISTFCVDDRLMNKQHHQPTKDIINRKDISWPTKWEIYIHSKNMENILFKADKLIFLQNLYLLNKTLFY